jgi:parallel beta-helix repeat protein
VLAVVGAGLAPDAHAGGFMFAGFIVVNSAADTNARDDVVTLREAILLATGELGEALTASELAQVSGLTGAGSVDTITFDPTVFPAGAPAVIALATLLPPLSTGDDAVSGVGAGVRITCPPGMAPAILLSSPGNAVRGLEIGGCTTAIRVNDDANDNVVGGTGAGQGNVLVDYLTGVVVGNSSFATTDGNRVVGNHLGVRPGAVVGTGSFGVFVLGEHDAVIEGNVISGNRDFGVLILGSRAVVRGNRIGTNTAGLVAVPNGVGVEIVADGPFPASSNLIGGPTDAERNIISGNDIGVRVMATDDGSLAQANVIAGNLIGTAVDGTTPLPNRTGVRLEGFVSGTRIGGIEPGAGNVIAFNDAAGVSVVGDLATQNAIVANAIHSNGSLAIDLGADGVTPNDDGDALGIGPNGLQNFPVITAVSYVPAEPPAEHGTLVVEGTLETAPLEGDLRVDLFANAACDPSGHGEGEEPLPALATTGLTTEADGSVGFAVSAVMPVPARRVLTATATSDVRGTSEMSACAMLVGFGEPCDGDAACDDGDDCNGVETCVDAACQGGAPLACDDGRACNGVATCADDVCQPGTPLECDDAERCTDDGCDDASGCRHDARTGVPGVTCRIDTMADLLAAAELPGKFRRKLGTRLERARAKVESADDLDGARQGRALRKTRRLFTGIGVLAVRQRGRKLPEATADALAEAATDALGRLAALVSALATAAPRDSGA